MVKKVSTPLVGVLSTSSKALEKILALEAEVSRLRHHVSVLSKRLNEFEPNRRKVSRAETSSPPVIEVDMLWLQSGVSSVVDEGVAEEV